MAITGGALALYALITAAVAATASTAIKASQGAYAEGGANDAFGDWLKTAFLSFGTSAIGGAASGAAGGASAGPEIGSQAYNQAVTAGQTAQLASAGVDAAAGIGADVAQGAAQNAVVDPMFSAEMAAADYAGPSAFDAVPEVGLSAAGEAPTSMFSKFMNISPSKDLFNMLGYDKGTYEMLDDYSNESDALSGILGNAGPQQQEEDNQWLEQKAFGLARGSLNNPFAQQGKQIGAELDPYGPFSDWDQDSMWDLGGSALG